ncbi:hypothetical protein BH20ACI4_BH20ACI4_07880 [soil metagenome]
MPNKQDLQDILNKMFAAERNFTFEVVSRWQNAYPHFKKEIAEAVADMKEFEFLVLDDADSLESSELSETAKNALEKTLAQFRPVPGETITDLRELAEKRGIERESLIERLGVSETLMRKIERRNLKEIPRNIEKKIAEILNISAESLRAFFGLPAMLPKSARYKAKNAPQTLPKQTFAEAVRADPELTGEEKRELLKTE